MVFSLTYTSAVAPETNVIKNLISEAIGIHGIDVRYQVVDTTSDPGNIYGSSLDRYVTSAFQMRMYGSLLEEESWMWSKFGMVSPDLIQLSILQDDFIDAVGQPPQVGDYVFIHYNNRLFEVTHVSQEDDQFLQTKFCYHLHLSAADIDGNTQNETVFPTSAIDNFEYTDPSSDDTNTIEDGIMDILFADNANPNLWTDNTN